jgi:hypothetical protein
VSASDGNKQDDHNKLEIVPGDGVEVRRVTRYKVVETQTVTDENLEQIINEWVAQGWVLDGIQFAMRESSKRPAMAFVVFTRAEAVSE